MDVPDSGSDYDSKEDCGALSARFSRINVLASRSCTRAKPSEFYVTWPIVIDRPRSTSAACRHERICNRALAAGQNRLWAVRPQSSACSLLLLHGHDSHRAAHVLNAHFHFIPFVSLLKHRSVPGFERHGHRRHTDVFQRAVFERHHAGRRIDLPDFRVGQCGFRRRRTHCTGTHCAGTHLHSGHVVGDCGLLNSKYSDRNTHCERDVGQFSHFISPVWIEGTCEGTCVPGGTSNSLRAFTARRTWRRLSNNHAAGITNMDNSGAVTMPPTIGAAMRCITSDPAP